METKSAFHLGCVAKCSKNHSCNSVSFSGSGQCLLSGEVLVFDHGEVTVKVGVNGRYTLAFAEAAARCTR
ncbi:hypothetical protein MAR_008750 [Mya arenaria]|uniref:Apple domain-containing protein n=1 Tax=Mya arenaria TaxID=6604 RepID=A0ABY7DZI3_MYAAR|nr:hypothetical protein MAR_008750 [Mya arenaria]